MNEYSFLIGVALTLGIALLSPGPSFLFVARTAVIESRHNAVAVALGLATGSAVFAMIASAGLLVLLESVPKLYIVLKVGGGIYLFYLGLKIWNNASTPVNDAIDPSDNTQSTSRAFMSGFLVQISNPKTAIVFGSVFAAFLPEISPTYASVSLVAISFSLAAVWYSLVAVLLSADKPRKTYGAMKPVLDRVAGGVMAAIGIKLAVAR